jgi:CheY-like chemotaxis protein
MPAIIPLQRALIVDGHEDTRDLYQALLVPRRYSVEHATNGREALRRAIQHPPDIIVTEIHLRDIDGFCLCELLRANRSTRTVPIVVLTADARPASLGRARLCGADVVLTKPCLPEVLLAAMNRIERKTIALGGRRVDRDERPTIPGQWGPRMKAS